MIPQLAILRLSTFTREPREREQKVPVGKQWIGALDPDRVRSFERPTSLRNDGLASTRRHRQARVASRCVCVEDERKERPLGLFQMVPASCRSCPRSGSLEDASQMTKLSERRFESDHRPRLERW